MTSHSKESCMSSECSDWADKIAAEKLPCTGLIVIGNRQMRCKQWFGNDRHDRDCAVSYRPVFAQSLREVAGTLTYGDAPTEARIMLGNALYPGLDGDSPEGKPNTLWAFAREAAERLVTLRDAEQRGYRRALEEACKAACKHCAEGKYPAGPCRGHWHHYYEYVDDEGETSTERMSDCAAWKIRNLLAVLLPAQKEQNNG